MVPVTEPITGPCRKVAMISLFDMLTMAGNGRAADAFADRFDMDRRDIIRAMEALVPAFSTGFRRNASTPEGFGAFLSDLASGRHARYFDDLSHAFSDLGMMEGNDILSHLFGSKQMSRAIAAQAAQATNISENILKQMLPPMALMIMGGLFRQTISGWNSFGAPGEADGESPQASNALINEALRNVIRAQQWRDNVWTGGQQATVEREAGVRKRHDKDETALPDLPANSPLNQIFDMFMRTNLHDQEASQAGTNARHKPEKPSGHSPLDDLLTQMFDSGRQINEDYLRTIEGLFETLPKSSDRDR